MKKPSIRLVPGGDGGFAVRFDAELVRRYDRAGPRYTSYPTAVQFHSRFGPPEYLRAVRETNTHLCPAPLSLYVHVPFCATVCYYCACTKVITNNRAHAQPYLERLFLEIERQAALFDRDREVRQLHWGGGTPTFLSPPQMQSLMDRLRRHFNFAGADGLEMSIEIDPRTVTAETVAFLRDLGFNRISLGVQDFDSRVQAAVNRHQTEAQTGAVLGAARGSGFRSVSVDLIYGLPLQTVATFDETLAKIIDIAPDRVSVFNYAHLPQMFKVQRQIRESELPPPEAKLEILGHTVERLTGAGYQYIGMDHFALPDDELAVAQRDRTLTRNFQGYSTRGECDIVGLGMSSIGKIDGCYAQNARALEEYHRAIDDGGLAIVRGVELSDDDRLRREVITRVACHGRIDFMAFAGWLDRPFGEYFAPELDALRGMEADGLVQVGGDAITVLPAGRLLLRNICMVFDRYLGDGAPRGNFSRVI